MLSESARASSAAEARFRIEEPNSRPRAVKVIALDPASQAVAKRLSGGHWPNATFLTAFKPAPAQRPSFSIKGWLGDLAGQTKDLVAEINSADLVIMLATAGQDAQAASIIGEACSVKRVMTTALVLGTKSVSDAALSQTLAQLRPWSLMLVIASAEEYIADMLTALRA